MASFNEVLTELADIKTGVVALKTLIANLPPAGVITQEQLDQLDAAADAILSVLNPTTPPIDEV